MPDPLCTSILAKIHEQIERTDHMVGKLPANGLLWTPSIPGRAGWSNGRLLGHLLDCLAGFCAVLAAVNPERLAHFSELRRLPVNQFCELSEARDRMNIYRGCIDEGFGLLKDTELARLIPTVFIAGGETVLTLLLGNLEHLINHKHQLFTQLRLMGIEVSTADLYQFRA
jgi:DinB family protein